MTQQYDMVDQPENYSTTLFPHQRTAIFMMEEKEQNKEIRYTNMTSIEEDDPEETIICSNLAIYSDLMGYGKTCSIVGLIIRDKMEWDLNENMIIKHSRNYCSGVLSTHKIEKFKKYNQTIILVSNSILMQWLNEIKKTNLKWIVMDKKKIIEDTDISNYEVILIIPTMYNKFIDKYYNYCWKRFVFDEPTHTHIPSMRNIRAGYYWLITATPDLLLYYTRWGRNNFFSNIFNWRMHYDLVKHLIVKNDDEYVKSSYKLPEVTSIYHECYQPMYNMVRNYIGPEVSRMIEAGDISNAIEQLGGHETSNIVDVIKERKQEQIEYINVRIGYFTRRNNQNRINTLKEEKLKLEKEIQELEEKFKTRLNEQCAICLDNLEEPILTSCCQNIYCAKCILEWLKTKSTCPLCRQSIHTSDNKSRLVYINNKTQRETEPKAQKLTKQDMIIKIINNNKNGKFVVFSEYTESFNTICYTLQKNKISYKELKGMSSTRAKYLQQFKDGKIKVLFLNSRINGAGINLQETTDIILYHETQEDLKKQVIGRANRIGRKDKLFVHYLI